MSPQGSYEALPGSYGTKKAADFVEGREGYDPEVGESLRDLAAVMARKAAGA